MKSVKIRGAFVFSNPQSQITNHQSPGLYNLSFSPMVTLLDIKAAQQTIRGVAARTFLIRCGADDSFFLKPESLQPVGVPTTNSHPLPTLSASAV